MDFWKSVTHAAEKAKALAETATEEAGKRLKELKLHERTPPSEELEYFGITTEFQDFIRTLNYSTFRDFPSEHLVPLQSGNAPADSSSQLLNPWQAQHARLVCQINEVNELRYVLCPRYMTDEHFWHVYFTIVKKYLPDTAYHWSEQDVLPSWAGHESKSGDMFSLENIGSQLKSFSSRLQQSKHLSGREATAIEMASATTPKDDTASKCMREAASADTSDYCEDPIVTASAAAGEPSNSKPAGRIADDPELEAYLQVAIDGAHGSSSQEYDGNDDDLDLDSYINEISAEVEESEKEKD